MSSYAIVPAWVIAAVSGEALRLYCALASFCSSERTCWPKRAAIAERAGASGPHWVTRYMGELVEAGAVVVEDETGRGNVYQLPEEPSTDPPHTLHRNCVGRLHRNCGGCVEADSTESVQSDSTETVDTPGGEGGVVSSEPLKPSKKQGTDQRAREGNTGEGTGTGSENGERTRSGEAPFEAPKSQLPKPGTQDPAPSIGAIGAIRASQLVEAVQRGGMARREPVNRPGLRRLEDMAATLGELEHWPDADELRDMIRWLASHDVHGMAAWARSPAGLARKWDVAWSQWLAVRREHRRPPGAHAPDPARELAAAHSPPVQTPTPESRAARMAELRAQFEASKAREGGVSA